MDKKERLVSIVVKYELCVYIIQIKDLTSTAHALATADRELQMFRKSGGIK